MYSFKKDVLLLVGDFKECADASTGINMVTKNMCVPTADGMNIAYIKALPLVLPLAARESETAPIINGLEASPSICCRKTEIATPGTTSDMKVSNTTTLCH